MGALDRRSEVFVVHPAVREKWLTKVSRILTGAYDIKAVWTDKGPAPSWWNPATREITVNGSDPKAKDSVDQHAYAKGKVFHEIAHTLYTEPVPFSQILARVGPYSDGRAVTLLNILEDGRIERCLALRCPGAQRYIRYVLRGFGPIHDEWSDLIQRVRHDEGYVYRKGSVFAKLDGLIREALRAKDTQAVAEIVQKIIPHLPALPPQPQPGEGEACFPKKGAKGKGDSAPKSKAQTGETESEDEDEEDKSDKSSDGTKDEEDGETGDSAGDGETGEDEEDGESDGGSGDSGADGQEDSEDGTPGEDSEDGTPGEDSDAPGGFSNPGTGEDRPKETEDEARERQAQEDKKQAEDDKAQVRRDSLAELEVMQQEIPPPRRQKYATGDEETAAANLARFLESLRFESTRPRMQPSRRSGRIDSSKIVGAMTGDTYRKVADKGPGFEFDTVLLIDESNSMEKGNKYRYTLKAGRIVFGALQRAGLNAAVLAFEDGVRPLEEIPLDGRATGWATNGQRAIDTAVEVLNKRPMRRRLIVMVTDGEFSCRLDNLLTLQREKVYIARIRITDKVGLIRMAGMAGLYSDSRYHPSVACHEEHTIMEETGEISRLPQILQTIVLNFARKGI
jgi:hypothetical protein